MYRGHKSIPAWVFILIFLFGCNENTPLKGQSKKDQPVSSESERKFQELQGNDELTDEDWRELEALPPEVLGGAYLTQTKLHCGTIPVKSREAGAGKDYLGCAVVTNNGKLLKFKGNLRKWDLTRAGKRIQHREVPLDERSMITAAFEVNVVDMNLGIDTSLTVVGAGNQSVQYAPVPIMREPLFNGLAKNGVPVGTGGL